MVALNGCLPDVKRCICVTICLYVLRTYIRSLLTVMYQLFSQSGANIHATVAMFFSSRHSKGMLTPTLKMIVVGHIGASTRDKIWWTLAERTALDRGGTQSMDGTCSGGRHYIAEGRLIYILTFTQVAK